MSGYTYSLAESDSGSYIINSIVSQLEGGAGGISGQPNWFTKISTLSSSSQLQYLLESTTYVDPVQAYVTTPAQTYRICFDADVVSGIITECRLWWGTAGQMTSLTTIDPGTPMIKLWDINTYPRPNTYRYTYRITIVNRGFAFVLNPDNVFNSVAANTTAFVCQRPVNPQTGQIRTVQSDGSTPDGTLPVFVMAISAPQGTPSINMSVIREIDVNAATPIRPLSAPSYYSLYKMDLGWNHPNILSNLTHVIKVPFGLATDRHMYMEEMDLIAFVHAGSFINGQAVNINTYSGSVYAGTRTYTGGFGNVDYNYNQLDQVLSGARVMLLTQSPGCSAYTANHTPDTTTSTPTEIIAGN